MTAIATLVVTIICIVVSNVKSQSSSSYPFETWMADWSGPNAISKYSGSIANSTIFDIVLPGANRAGMSFDTSSSSTSVTTANDFYRLTINSLSSNQKKRAWSARQKGSILELLRNGVRFLDLPFEYDSSSDEYYAYNGVYGRTLTEILSDLGSFLATTGTQEIVLVYLRDFISDGSIGERSSQLINLMDTFATDTVLASKMANSSVDNLHTRTIYDLINRDNIQLIVFTDEYPTDPYDRVDLFYDAESYLLRPTGDTGNSTSSTGNSTDAVFGQLDEISEVRSFVINHLRFGWPADRLNLIYWKLDIGATFTEQHIYSGFQHFASGINNELNAVLNTYPKLYFANVVIVDFFSVSDIMQQVLLLNYQYFTCKDAMWGNNDTSCPSLTDLDSKYFTDDISPLCTINSNLQSDAYCRRSCGNCSAVLQQANNPGDACTDDAECDGILYNSDYGYSSDQGECFVRPATQRYRDNVKQTSFCLALEAQPSCTNYDVEDKCASGEDEIGGIDISDCQQYCSANWQCQDGYCNTEYSVCMTLNAANRSATTQAPTSRHAGYSYIESEGAEQMLKDVAIFRPGDYQAAPDPNGEGIVCQQFGPNCLLSGMDANPYFASLLGFAVIPFIAAWILCGCYFVSCCPCWCCCDQCGKKCCCCHKVLGDPIEEKNRAKHYTPLAFLASCLIVVLWACIEGIVNNAEMHNHIFGEQDSVKFAVNDLFDEVIGRFTAVEPTAEYIIDFGIGILNDVFLILENNTDSVAGTIDGLYSALNILEKNYSNGVNLTGDFMNPFNTSQREEFSVECPYCDFIGETASNIKDQLNSSLGGQLNQVDQLINQTKGFLNARDQIKNATESFFNTLNEVINTSNEIQTTANEYIDMAADYDKQYREEPAFLFFCIPMGLIIFVIAGVIMKNKWCFKCEWFCAMYCCGTPIMLLSWPFIFFAVLWGDVCVRLDDFEQNLGQSQVGQLAGLDNVTEGSPPDLGLKLLNTCFAGGSPLELFNLTQFLNWDDLRTQLDEQLDVDITGYLETDEISQFKTELDTLSVDEFGSVVDSYIAAANALGSYCGCGQRDTPFTRQNLYGDGSPVSVAYCAEYEANDTSVVNGTTTTLPPGLNFTANVNGSGFNFGRFGGTPSPYWMNTTLSDGGDCFNAFVNASAAVQIEFSLTDEANDKITDIKTDADRVFDVYDQIYGIAVNLEQDISQISCLVDPLFVQFDIIIDNFTNCGFLGEAYGNFKQAGCVDLFDDWYKIARALSVIAWISIMIVFFGMCMDYIYGPVRPRMPSIDEMPYEGSEVEVAPVPETDMTYGNVELVTPVGAMDYGTSPGQFVQAAPQRVHGSVYSVHSASHPDAAAPASTYEPQATAQAIAVSYVSKPVVAESEVQEYSIKFDDDPAADPAGNLQPISQGDEPFDEGGAAETGNHEEPVVPSMEAPGSERNAVVLADDAPGIELRDSSDED